MKILDYVRKLLPFFPRNRLQEDFRACNNELNTIVVPALEQLAADYKSGFKSKTAKDLAIVYKSFNRFNQANFFLDLLDKTKDIKALMQSIEKAINDGFEEKVVSSSLTVKKANVVRLVSMISFFNKYTMSMINVVLHEELIAAGSGSEYISDVTPAEIERVTKLMVEYATFVSNVSKVKDHEKVLVELPEVLVQAEGMHGAFSASMDPYQVFGRSNFKGSPMYLIAMAVAEYQHKQYKKMQAQKATLEKRLLALKRAQMGQASPELEQEIEALSSKVADLAESLRKYEEDLA